ncbi:MAG: CPBP family intramembrane glutamic endopeptidase [Gemmatimonadota bacterium]
MKQRLLLAGAVLAAAVLVWLATSALPAAARLWTTLLLAFLPAMLVGQAAALGDAAELPRRGIYASTIVSLWLLALATVAMAVLAGWGPAELLLRRVAPVPFLGWSLGLVAAALVVFVAGHLLGFRELPLTRHLLPVTGPEKAWFVVLSVTAGVTEEVVFRGFLLTALILATGSTALAIGLSAALFGVVHGYQGPWGAVRPAALGVLFAVSAVVTGSVLPAMVAHALVDIISGLWLGRRLTG